ncbi:MAG TPA: hypothetical protein VLG50_02255 [Candidatus Saccharimonadales bacterium]|nr:hypothetical protein [Candidatus Saccharimonadales bacterium]
MDYKKNKNKEQELLVKLGGFSKNMVQNHHLENLSEFIIHDLCSQDAFNINKAAYLVNNPDFSCLKGVAGYHHPESFKQENSWELQKEFTSHMKQSDFNQNVRSINDKSLVIHNDGPEQDKVYELIERLDMHDPLYHTWNMKYDNQGIFIFEKPEDTKIINDHLLNFLHMLSFCSIF